MFSIAGDRGFIAWYATTYLSRLIQLRIYLEDTCEMAENGVPLPFFSKRLFSLAKYLAQHRLKLFHCSEEFEGVGFTSENVQTGDVIGLISGVSMPMVLRPKVEGYEVISPAFLSGVMDGELWQDIDIDALTELRLV